MKIGILSFHGIGFSNCSRSVGKGFRSGFSGFVFHLDWILLFVWTGFCFFVRIGFCFSFGLDRYRYI